ncbi:MAG: glycosyltransferase family 2 protein [Bacteroidales bacterium]|nr:glycosyltransferase family 2 protein [Bacteroidales bacterium]
MSSNDFCVIVPTYNNIRTLSAVIDSILPYTSKLIVVNDGSTDGTDVLLDKKKNEIGEGFEVVSYEKNKGKWNAISKGLGAAAAAGFRYAITMDSDGQHFASDIPNFVAAAAAHPDALIVGSRVLKIEEDVPQKNIAANKFSNFWFKVQTFINLPDTQSGFRLYPVEKVNAIHIFSGRYEAELEVLVRAAWRFIEVIPIPVAVYYAPAGERTSHFRPFADFMRISVLNTFLTFAAILWFYPQKLWRHFRMVFQKRTENSK